MRAEADESLLGESPQDMIAALAVDENAGALERAQQLIARHLVAALQDPDEHLFATGKNRIVEFQFLTATGRTGDNPRGQKFEHPVHIGGGHKMQRTTHRPGADNRAIGDGLRDIGFGGGRQA